MEAPSQKILKSASPFSKGSTQISSNNFFNSDNDSRRHLAYPIENTSKVKIIDIRRPTSASATEIEFKNFGIFLENSKSVTLPNGDIYITGGFNDSNDSCIADTLKLDLTEKSYKESLDERWEIFPRDLRL